MWVQIPPIPIRKSLFKVVKRLKSKKFIIKNSTSSKLGMYVPCYYNKNHRFFKKICLNTGRFRAVFSKFKLTRYKLREFILSGDITGFKKSAW